MPDLGWVVQLLGAFATAFFASTVFSGRGKDFMLLALASGLVVVTALLGAGWVVHPAAGMLLAFMIGWMDGGTRRWEQNLPMIGVALLSAAAFMFFGAGWLQFPLVIILIITAFSYLSNLGRTEKLHESSRPAELPETTTGVPAQPVTMPETVPVQQRAATQPARQAAAVPSTGLASLHHDQRLPAEARALLVAIDYRTAEAQRALHDQGQTGTQAAYEARAIREEYAPAAVQAYLKLPPTRADTTPIDGQKTGRDLLIEQLELLLDAAQNLIEVSTHSGGKELLANARFLREKFGQGSVNEQDLKLK